MRLSAVFSALFHVAIVVLAMTTFANRSQFSLEAPENIPVELLTVADITNVSAAIEEAEELEPPEEEVIAEPEPEPEPQQMAALPDPVLELPEPEAEYLPSEDEPQPVEPEPDPEPTPPPPPSVRPVVRPQPPERAEEFDFAQAAALIDLAPQEEEPEFNLDDLQIGEETEVQTAERSRAAVGLGTGLTISEKDALKAAIEDCWNPPVGARDAEDLVVELRVHFNSDGTVRDVDIMDFLSYSSDNFYRAAAESARRAVHQCENRARFDGSYRQGYDLPADEYDSWRSVILEFNPRNFLGGG